MGNTKVLCDGYSHAFVDDTVMDDTSHMTSKHPKKRKKKRAPSAEVLKDRLNQDIEVGDTVCITKTGYGSGSDIHKGIIERMSKAKNIWIRPYYHDVLSSTIKLEKDSYLIQVQAKNAIKIVEKQSLWTNL